MALSDFQETTFEYQGFTHPVFRRGEGPGIVVIHEVPGITPQVIRFAERLVDEGFTVVMPSLFGTPGKAFSLPYVGQQLARLCISREFHVLARNHSSPVTDWLRALCRDVYAQIGGVGIGVIGMCATGNFALSLMLDSAVIAPVVSQPALPFAVSPSHKRALQLSDNDLAVVKRRVSEGIGVLGLCFTHDVMCPAQRFARLRQELGGGFEGIEIDSGPGNPHRIPRRAHSVLTIDFVDQEGHPTRQALERVLAFFREKLIEGKRPEGS